VKLVVEEPESAALEAFMGGTDKVASSRIAYVEVAAAVARGAPDRDPLAAAEALTAQLVLVDVTPPLLRRAAALARPPLRAFDAIHLASALLVDADEMLVYDRRLAAAAQAEGLAVVAPGT